MLVLGKRVLILAVAQAQLAAAAVRLARLSAPDSLAAPGRVEAIDAVAVAVVQVEPVPQALQPATVEWESHQISLRLQHMLNMAAVVLDRQ